LKSILVAALLSLASAVCYGQEFTENGNDLMVQCQSAVKFFDHEQLDGADHVHAAYCIGYVSAILDLDAMWLGMDKKAGVKNLSVHICSPDGGGVAVSQAVRILVKWLKNNPEKLDWRGETVVVLALRQAFPCQ